MESKAYAFLVLALVIGLIGGYVVSLISFQNQLLLLRTELDDTGDMVSDLQGMIIEKDEQVSDLEEMLISYRSQWPSESSTFSARANGVPKLITIVFDDAKDGVYETIWPMMRDTYNMRGVLAPFCSSIGTEGYMTVAQIFEVINSGWELASHSMTHPDLTAIDDVQLEDELLGSLQIFRSLSGARALDPVTFVYPFGKANANVINCVKKYYQIGLGVAYTSDTSGINIYGSSSAAFPHYYMPRFLINSAHLSDGSLARVINETKKGGGWLILYMHDLGSGEDLAYSTELDTVLTLIRDSGLPVVTAMEGMKIINGSAWRHRTIDPWCRRIFRDVFDSGTDSDPISCILYGKRTIVVRNTMDMAATIQVYGGVKEGAGSTTVHYDQLGGDYLLTAGNVTAQTLIIDVSENVDFIYVSLTQDGRTTGTVNAWLSVKP